MKKWFLIAVCILLSLLCVTALADVVVNETNFPDAVFRAYVSDNFDTDHNGSLSAAEIKAAEIVDL